MANGRIKIMELPETAFVKDNDIFIIENDTVTQKISLGSLIDYIKEHEEIAEHFVKQSAVGSPNGVAPLDSSQKIPSANLPFGSTENTVYDGALGQALSDSLSLHRADTGNPHAVTKSQIGLSNVDNTADIAKPVSTLQQQAIDTAYAGSNAYTDAKIAELIDGAPSTLDTLGEIAQALQEGGGISDALDAAIGTKASRAELDSHTGNDTIHITASERTKWNSKMGSTEDAGSTTITFSEASDLSEINSGEKTGTIMGKISKAVSTLISHLSSKATAEAFGHVKLSDAYQNALTDGAASNGVGASQKALAEAYSALSSDLGNCTFSVQPDGAYVTYTPEGGADAVTKKLGSRDISDLKTKTYSGTATTDGRLIYIDISDMELEIFAGIIKSNIGRVDVGGDARGVFIYPSAVSLSSITLQTVLINGGPGGFGPNNTRTLPYNITVIGY